jgi:hypothetical protein
LFNPHTAKVAIIASRCLESSIANNLGEGFEHGPHFYRLTDKIVTLGPEDAISTIISSSRPESERQYVVEPGQVERTKG